MSIRTWLFIAALGLNLISPALADPPEQYRAERQSEKAPQSQDGEPQPVESFRHHLVDWLSAKLGVTGCGPYPVDRLGRSDEVSKDQYYADCDLEAQESVANSTRWLLTFAIPQLVLTIFGTFLVLRTLRFNRQATAAALKGADAAFKAVEEAQRANDLAAKNAVTDQRPWLHVEVVNLEKPRVFTSAELEREFTVSANLKIINTGKTPAQEVEVLVETVSQSDLRKIVEDAFGESKNDKFHVVGVVPPNAKLETDFPASRPFTDIPDQIDFVFTVSLYCVVRYTTRSPGVKGTRYITTQQFIIEHDDGRRRTAELATYPIRNGHGKLMVRPGAGVMT